MKIDNLQQAVASLRQKAHSVKEMCRPDAVVPKSEISVPETPKNPVDQYRTVQESADPKKAEKNSKNLAGVDVRA